jgi:hypothetical protein
MNIRRLALPLQWLLYIVAKAGYNTNQGVMPLHNKVYRWIRKQKPSIWNMK